LHNKLQGNAWRRDGAVTALHPPRPGTN
jgi:hypothetical protein